MSSAMRHSVYVVDDDKGVRDALRWILRAAGFRVELYATAEHFLDAHQPRTGSCLILEVRMPGMSGFELQEELVRRREYLPIIFLTSHGDVRTAVLAMKRGAFDFLQKPCNGEVLVTAVRHALRHTVDDLARTASRVEITDRLASLSAREYEVLACVLDGKTNKAIASTLAISVKTVECHRSRIMEKVGANSVAELVRLVTAGSQTVLLKPLTDSGGQVAILQVAARGDVSSTILTGS
jgi:two-component system response regulator FixJ